MIFGTDQFVIHNGEELQVCIVDAIFPDGHFARIHILADSGDGYILMPGTSASREYDVCLYDKKKTAVLFPKGLLFVIKETETWL